MTDNLTALRCWMIAGPEMIRVIMEFEDENTYLNASEGARYREETSCCE